MAKILIVDNSRVPLRAVLEGAFADCEVVVARSAEEGLLELDLFSYDLLITQIRLPGISGLEFVPQAQRRQADLPIFVMAKALSAVEQQRGKGLGVRGYFTVPLEEEEVITAVSNTLSLSPTTLIEPPPNLPLAPITSRLASLRSETSATGVLLVDMHGEIQVQEIGAVETASLPQVAMHSQKLMQCSFDLADSVRSQTTSTFQYHMLDVFKIYSANVGRRYFLLLLFDTVSQVGGISMISVFTQRAIKDLLVLVDDTEANSSVMETAELVGAPDVTVDELGETETAVFSPASVDKPETSPLALPEADPLTEEEMAQLLDLDFDAAPADIDLDAFWESTDEEDDGEGMSLEEAKKLGLIPSDLTFDDDDN